MKAAKALRYKAVQTVYVWPDELSELQTLRVRNALDRMDKKRVARERRQAHASGART